MEQTTRLRGFFYHLKTMSQRFLPQSTQSARLSLKPAVNSLTVSSGVVIWCYAPLPQ